MRVSLRSAVRKAATTFPPILAMGDVSTGVHAYAAVATALLHRERTGEGQHLDLSLLDSYFHYHDIAVEMVSASHGTAKVKRTGNQVGALSPAGIFRTKTGALWIFRLPGQSLGGPLPDNRPNRSDKGSALPR